MGQVLLVDDDPMLRRMLRAMLERAGHVVIEAEDGDQGMAMFVEHKPDLVLTDIIMPNREGVEFIGALRRENSHAPIIAMSGGGSKGGELFLRLATQLGATRTLDKPIRQETLLATVDDCLNHRAPDSHAHR